MIGTVEEITFRVGDSDNTRVQKLEVMRRAVVNSNSSRTLYISISDGLPDADPDEPLFRVRMRENTTLGAVVADAGDAATGTPAFRVRKDGADNGGISFTGTVGTGNITESFYEAGSLFELLPPDPADATLDDVSISIPVTVS